MLEPDALERHLREQGNRALEKGALAAFALAGVNVVMLPAALLSGAVEGLWAPWAFSICCAVACAGTWSLARRRMLVGPMAWVVLLGFTSLPTFFFLGCEWWLPAGAATFVNGPLVLLYFVLIALTGCLFDPRLSLASGAVAALGFGLVSLLALPELQTIEASDPLLRQDLVDPAIYFFKCVMIAFGGAVVAALAVVARRLAVGVAEEAAGRARVHGLLGTYVSEEVAARLVAGVEAGQRVDAVVLFSDLRGFTAYSEQAEPEAIVERLNAYFEEMVTAIHAEGGVVDKFVGDAVMAVFGGLVAIDEPAMAAVRAARGMQLRLAALNERWQPEGVRFEAGIGLHAGELVQGAIGSAARRDFTVIGDVVNTASRVEGLTKTEGRPVLLTQAVMERLSQAERSTWESLGERALKGRSEKLELFAESVARGDVAVPDLPAGVE